MEVGDTVMTGGGKLYIIRSFFRLTKKQEDHAYLQPMRPGPTRKHTHARVETLTLVRSRELSLVFHYAADSEREAAPDWMRENARKSAAHWLGRAEERNDDSRAALCLGSDRIMDLEAAS